MFNNLYKKLQEKLRNNLLFRAGFSSVILLIVAGAILTITYFVAFTGSSSSTDSVEVVSVYNLPEQTAVEILETRGLKVEIERDINIQIAAGLVYGQEPLPGAKLDEGSQVTLFISQGGNFRPVPEVVGQDLTDAERILQSREFGFQTQVEFEEDPEIEGIVIRQTPAKGEKLAPGETVQLVVSSGVERVPDVRDFFVDDAVSFLQRMGYEIEVQAIPSTRVIESYIINTNPPPGAPAPESRKIIVQSSAGPEVSEFINLPNVVGFAESLARRELEELGFVLTVTYRDAGLTEQGGVVVGQLPAAGLDTPEGANIRIFVTRFEDGVDPS